MPTEVGAPAISVSGELLYARVLPLMARDSENEWFGRYLCDGLMAMLQNLDQIVLDTPTHPGWCTILDPEVCPDTWLPWCAQIYGVTLTPNATPEAQRHTIVELPPQKRGGVQAIIAAVKPTLTGTKEVRVIEQVDYDAYRIDVLTRTSETPNPTASEAAARSQKAGGLIMTFSTSEPPIIDEGTRTIDAATGTIDAATLAAIT